MGAHHPKQADGETCRDAAGAAPPRRWMYGLHSTARDLNNNNNHTGEAYSPKKDFNTAPLATRLLRCPIMAARARAVPRTARYRQQQHDEPGLKLPGLYERY
jgi:hypothetical protein